MTGVQTCALPISKKLARPITLSEFEIDPDEWMRLCNENGSIRLLEGGKKIASKPADYYDKEIMALLTEEPTKLSKLLSLIYSKTTINISDVFVVWRLRLLERMNKITVEGDWEKGWKEIVLSSKL